MDCDFSVHTVLSIYFNKKTVSNPSASLIAVRTAAGGARSSPGSGDSGHFVAYSRKCSPKIEKEVVSNELERGVFFVDSVLTLSEGS